MNVDPKTDQAVRVDRNMGQDVSSVAVLHLSDNTSSYVVEEGEVLSELANVMISFDEDFPTSKLSQFMEVSTIDDTISEHIDSISVINDLIMASNKLCIVFLKIVPRTKLRPVLFRELTDVGMTEMMVSANPDFTAHSFILTCSYSSRACQSFLSSI